MSEKTIHWKNVNDCLTFAQEEDGYIRAWVKRCDAAYAWINGSYHCEECFD